VTGIVASVDRRNSYKFNSVLKIAQWIIDIFSKKEPVGGASEKNTGTRARGVRLNG